MKDHSDDRGPPATLADLTTRQLVIASLIAKAMTDKQIAGELKITDRTVWLHVEALTFLLHLDPAGNVRIQIALWYREHCAPIVTAA